MFNFAAKINRIQHLPGLTFPQLRIAVNTRFLLPGKLEGLGWYTHELLRRMVENHPADEFIFLFDRPFDPAFIYGKNVIPVVAGPRARHPLAWLAWFEWSVPRALKRYGAQVFFSPDAHLSLRAKTPTVMTVHDLIPLQYPTQVRWWARAYYRWFIPLFLRRADRLVAVSGFTKQEIENTGIAPGRISVLYNGCRDGFRPLPPAEQQQVRDHFAGGQAYFFYTGAIHPRKNIPRLLRAFDAFKTATGAPVKLLLAGRFAWQTGAVKTAYEQARHRQDIHFLGYVPEADLTRLMASALALTYLSIHEGFGLPLIEAMNAGTPVLAARASCLPEIAGDAALLVDPFSEEAIAAGLECLYLDEALRQTLIEKGNRRRTDFSWDTAAAQLYDLLASLVANEKTIKTPGHG